MNALFALVAAVMLTLVLGSSWSSSPDNDALACWLVAATVGVGFGVAYVFASSPRRF